MFRGMPLSIIIEHSIELAPLVPSLTSLTNVPAGIRGRSVFFLRVVPVQASHRSVPSEVRSNSLGDGGLTTVPRRAADAYLPVAGGLTTSGGFIRGDLRLDLC